MSPSTHSPTLLGIPTELRIKIYEFLFRSDDIFVLKPGSPLHPHLTLLRVCRKIHAEARITVIQNVKLRILASENLPIPYQIRDAYICYAQEIILARNDFLWDIPNMDFLGYAKMLRNLRVGYIICSRGTSSSLSVYRAAINSRRADSLQPITSVTKVWDDYLLSDVISRCGIDPATAPDESSRRRLQWLHHLIDNKDRGFKLTGLIGASLSPRQVRTLGQKGVKLQPKFDFDTFEIVERKVWGIEDIWNENEEEGDESEDISPILTEHDARLHALDEEVRRRMAQATPHNPEQEGKQTIWVGDCSDPKMPTLDLA